VYKQLNHLINEEWNTRETLKVKDKLNFKGFYGDYEAELHYDNKAIKKEFSISKGKENSIEL
jgi:hypothetical protein